MNETGILIPNKGVPSKATFAHYNTRNLKNIQQTDSANNDLKLLESCELDLTEAMIQTEDVKPI